MEIGCGPGFTSCEMGGWVGNTGSVTGIDINREFIDFARSLATDRGLGDVVDFRHVNEPDLPGAADSLDCVVARNVLLYVDDPLHTLTECRRVLRPGGRVHAIEGDWGLLLAEPVPEPEWRTFIDAA